MHLRQLAVAADEGARKVGTARDVAPPNLGVWPLQLLHLGRAPTLRVFAQRRAGAAQAAQFGECGQAGQGHACLVAVGIKRGTGTKKRHTRLCRKAPNGEPIGLVFGAAGVAVINHTSGAVEQAAGLCVPHDPTGGAIPVVALTPAVGVVAATNVVVQNFERQRHHHGAAVAMHDGFGQAGGAAGIDNPQRMIER